MTRTIIVHTIFLKFWFIHISCNNGHFDAKLFNVSDLMCQGAVTANIDHNNRSHIIIFIKKIIIDEILLTKLITSISISGRVMDSAYHCSSIIYMAEVAKERLNSAVVANAVSQIGWMHNLNLSQPFTNKKSGYCQ
eukprot:CAMPEP_0176358372 /NCGR_PEP_ID=MMETSP0126-20121128/15511_1 /TAXON_ID=141414 ORGANISM="Strombidinopsis acuminatum, Strain SPMC142" /NCGR_SAMPLE_ID=MMETSP0126 /ASSEMBLY_ACC=CAM_ASM_000229 /LENGTH=135 /DNA_ID=CAMNT_0017712521 /DNA_START=1152 /DNA_END=1559 /DNA_ORIENTATION=+